MANVLFKVGTRAQYEALEVRDPNTLYWLTDTQELRKGEFLYGIGKAATKEADGLLSAEDKALLDKLVESGVSGLHPANASLEIGSDEDGMTVAARLSKVDGNILRLESDGLFVPSTGTADVPEYAIERMSDAGSEYTATYKLKRTLNGESEYVGDEINIPKDLVIKSGSVEKVTQEGVPYEDAHVGDLYIDIILSDEAGSHIYIPANELVDEYTAGHGIEIINHEISIKLDEDNANGLSVGENGLALAEATKDSAGALSAVDKEFIDAIPVLYDEVHYSFSSLLDGARVGQHDKEYRLMFSKDTAWTKQKNDGSNKNYNANRYYVAMRAYAPDDSVVYFKEDTEKIITDDTMFDFNGPFSGTDEYGRKYSVVWLPVAKYDEDTDKWTYFGATSTNDKYIGWYYTVEWYNADKVCVASDTIRINLSNEECHNSIKPFYVSESALVWSEM